MSGDGAAPVAVARAEKADFTALADAFATWPKPAALFEAYRVAQSAGRIEVLAARVDDGVAGYCLVEWESSYPFFRAERIPEVADLNVLPARRGRGAGGLLLARAEELISTRSATAGLRVGLYADYGVAQRMYVRHGYLPDGRGVTVDGRIVAPGATIALDDDAVLAFTRSLR